MTSLFECRVKYAKIDQASGKEATVTELYLIDAINYTEAEERIHKEMEQYVSGEFAVKRISPANYSELVMDDIEADKFFKVKTTFMVFDENINKEKKTNVCTLFMAANIEDALARAIKYNEVSAYDYTIVSVTETAILEFFKYDVKEVVEDSKSKAYKED